VSRDAGTFASGPGSAVAVRASSGYHFGAVVPFALLHVAALGILFVPFSWSLVAWFAGSYLVRMFGVTAGYHRYFSHRSYRLGRVAQFALAVLAQTSGQKGALWWAAHHRHHHRNADEERDIHSPWRQGFWWSHAGWILSNRYDKYDAKRIADFSKYPELRWLDRHHWVPTVVYAAAILALGGPAAFLWGYVASTVFLYHATFTINSLAHVWGSRRFETPDESRNNLFLALLTLGEGWHNNHHHSMGSCRQGYRWWELDITWLALRVIGLFGIARDFRGFRAERETGTA
jgi:stearoyl-CoA desaturase (delta-9 desaturase)